MANILVLAAIHRNRRLPLRGDMEGVNLDFTPTDNKFKAHFYTEDTKSYTLNSAHKFFINGAVANSITFGGRADLSIEMFFDPVRSTWVVTDHNLNAAAENGSGTAIDTVSQATIDAIVNRLVPAGGPSGYLLGKSSGTNYAMAWVAPTAVTDNASPAYLTGGNTLQYWGKTGNADGQVGWLTLPVGGGSGGGSGIGTGYTAEVVLTPDGNNEVTPDKALGTSFRVVLKPGVTIKINNPEGFVAGEHLSIVLAQPPEVIGTAFAAGSMDWGLHWAHPNRQPPVLANTPNAINKVSALLTAGNAWLTDVTPDGTKTLGYGAAAFVARNTSTGVSYYVLRSPTQVAAMTAMKPGETLKILRNSLGIEAYGALDNVNGAGNYLISGALPNLTRAELRTGPGVRAAYDRGVLAFGGNGLNVTVQDLIVSGAREQSGTAHIAQGVAPGQGANVTLRNVRMYDNENGILSPNDYTGTLSIIDCELDANGVGADFGFVHNIYANHHEVGWSALRSTFKNCVGGHNIKSRAGTTTLNQVHCYNSTNARELDLPNGGKLYATNCIFEHLASGAQNDCIRIAAEGVTTTRPREYIFRNCHFINGKNVTNAASFVWNEDPDVDCYLIDCTFSGGPWADSDIRGNRGRVIVQFTPGVTPGPQLPVGYQSIPVTPIAG